jgi:hypothetical protein
MTRFMTTGATGFLRPPAGCARLAAAAARGRSRCRARRGRRPPVGGAELWGRVGGELVVDPAKLMAARWTPSRDTEAALTIAARAPLPSA